MFCEQFPTSWQKMHPRSWEEGFWFLFYQAILPCHTFPIFLSRHIAMEWHFPPPCTWLVYFGYKKSQMEERTEASSVRNHWSTHGPRPAFTTLVLFNPVPRKRQVTDPQIRPATVYCALTGLGPGGHCGKATPWLPNHTGQWEIPIKQTKFRPGEN